MSLFGPPKPPDIQRMKEKKDFNGLIKATQPYTDKTLRLEAITALGDCRCIKAVPTLLGILDDYSYSAEFKKRSAIALGKIGIPAMPHLLKIIERCFNGDTLKSTIQGLGLISDARVVYPLLNVNNQPEGPGNISFDVEGDICNALAQVGSVAVEPLIAALSLPNDKVRKRAVMSLDKIHDVRAIDAFYKVKLNESDWGIRIEVIAALKNFSSLCNHDWKGCVCSICGHQRDEEHTWDGCMCSVCFTKRDEGHKWEGCKCYTCGAVRTEGHSWDHCKCGRCGATRYEGHVFRELKENTSEWMDHGEYISIGSSSYDYECIFCGKLVDDQEYREYSNATRGEKKD